MTAINKVIDDKYEILKMIGQGGMSKVYLAMDRRLNKQWAIKEVTKNDRDRNNVHVVQSAMAEANMLKRLDHPSLPRIVDIIEDPQRIYVVMDYVEGESLDKVLSMYGAQTQEQVINWAKQLCGVLNYLHSCTPPIIYRDMKPANVVLQPNGNIKLLDFGIAREYKDQKIEDTVSLGTKGYAAPEQFGGKGQTDVRTDIYCLGVTLYHLVTGHNPCEPPYELYPIRQWNPNLSGGLERIIQKCTQLNPEDRYQSSAELLYALERYETFDDAYRQRQKKIVFLQSFLTVAAILFIGAGFLSLGLRARTNNSDYENLIQLAQKTTSETDTERLYISAIEIKPSEAEAYRGLVNIYKADAVFSIREEEALTKVLRTNLSELRDSSDYADLAFQIGKLYWYYYDYGKSDATDNQITRMKSSIQWFEDAVLFGSENSEYHQMATIYRDIGMFNRDIVINVQEASDSGKYAPYFNNMVQLLEMINNSPDENEIVLLEVYKLSIYSIENYARKFKADGITRDSIQEAFDNAERGLSSVSATTDKADELKATLDGRLEIAQSAIDNAYSE
ncbi:MAG: serine/threonine protein kinase [Clostridiaceae bacterium]|nr:serine/threonine protein kinase [Clostridiaceae bacterium]